MALWRETGKAGLALCARLAARSGLRASVASSQQHQQRDFVKLPDLSQAANAIGTFLDGKVAEAKYIHPYMFKQAEFVGEDYNGNKYYEIKKGVLYGRHRWFVPKDLYDYSPASVPPEWHGWLHNVSPKATPCPPLPLLSLCRVLHQRELTSHSSSFFLIFLVMQRPDQQRCSFEGEVLGAIVQNRRKALHVLGLST